MDNPTVSVVIPVFNGERYVAVAIDSVLSQTRLPNEVIVVDDGSTDGTAAILAAFGDRIHVIRQANAGTAAANNRAVAAATGSVLAFLDADDLWLPQKLEAQMQWLDLHSETDAVFGHLRQFISEDLTESDAARLVCPPDPQPGINKTTMAVRREAFERVGPFDRNLRSGDFVDWYARAVDQRLSSHTLPQVVAMRRLHNGNMGLCHRGEQRSDNVIALKRMLDRRRRRAQEASS